MSRTEPRRGHHVITMDSMVSNSKKPRTRRQHALSMVMAQGDNLASPSQFALLRRLTNMAEEKSVRYCGCGQRRCMWAASPPWRRCCHGFVHPIFCTGENPRLGSSGQAAAAPRRRPLLGGAVWVLGVSFGGVAGVGCLICLGCEAWDTGLSCVGCCHGHEHPGRYVLHQ